MKKIICILCVVVMVAGFAAAFAGCEKREEVLKIFLPGQYIDEGICEEFTDWYFEQTGEKMKVKLKDFEEVEDIQRELLANADYDLVCPSDYMVEYLISEKLIQKVDKEILNVAEEGLFKSNYLDVAREYDPTLEYSVPYMYGTLGIVYDYSKTNNTELKSWADLFGDTYKDHRSIKQSIRDAYAAACLYNANITGKTGAEQKAAVQDVFLDFSDSTIAAAKQTLTSVKSTSIWDVDNVKFEMAADSGSDVIVALMWSCDAGYVMNTYEDANGKEQEGNKNLWYYVPDEGGNIYMDNFCIPTNAVNTKAANYFLKYLCQKEIAMRNSEYAGAISPVASAYDHLKASYEANELLYEGTVPGWKGMFIDMLFPSEDTLNRCGVMKDLGDRKNALNEMWADIVG